jgi:hypothetical protein
MRSLKFIFILQNFSAFKSLRCLTLENIHFEDIVAGLRHTPNLVQLEVRMLLY